MIQNQQKVSLIPYIFLFIGIYFLASIILGFIGLKPSVSLFPTSMLSAFITAHIFFKRHNRLINNAEQLKLSLITTGIILILSLLVVYFLLPTEMKILASVGKSSFFIIAIIFSIGLLFIANLSSLKIYNSMLRKNKNYNIDENGEIISNYFEPINHREGRITEIPDDLAEKLAKNNQYYQSKLVQNNQNSTKKWIINIGILVLIIIGVVIIIGFLAKSK